MRASPAAAESPHVRKHGQTERNAMTRCRRYGQRIGVCVCVANVVILLLLSPRSGKAAQSSTLGLWPGPFITVTWDPSPDPNVAGYVVYVGTASKQYIESYDAGNRTAFVYPSARLNQRYYIAVASYDGGRNVGAPSVEVSAIGRLLPPTEYFPALVNTIPVTPDGTAAAAAARTPGCRVITGCYRTTTAMTRLADINALAVTPGGAVWFVENSRQVSVLSTTPAVALAEERPGVQLAAIVVDPRFEQTHWIYVEEIVGAADGTRELTIARYREVSNTLGDRAAIVAGVRLPPAGHAPFTVDAEGRIYIAVPAADDDVEAYGGAVLAFERDGAALRENPAVSPILSRAFANPTALLWDAESNFLWLSGIDTGVRSMIARTPARPSPSGRWPAVPETVTLVSAPDAFANGARPTREARARPLSAPDGRLLRVDHQPARISEVALDTGERVIAAASGPAGVFYVVSHPAAGVSRIVVVDVE
jgi:hypothetical protein